MTPSPPARFAFELYDRDSSNSLSLDEVLLIIRDVYDFSNRWLSQDDRGEVVENGDVRLRKAVANVKRRMDTTGVLDEKGFESFVDANEMVLFPCFKLHQKLRAKLVGEAFWSRVQQQRRGLRLVKGRPIGDPWDSRELIRALFWDMGGITGSSATQQASAGKEATEEGQRRRRSRTR